MFFSITKIFFQHLHVLFHLKSVPPAAVGERLIKSKIIPDQARALAHALKHAVVKPLKKSMMTKKKSLDITNLNEPTNNTFSS